MNKIIIAIMIVAAIIFQSCESHQVNNNALPEKWFNLYAPYTEGSIIKYTNGTDSMLFDIKNIKKEKSIKNKHNDEPIDFNNKRSGKSLCEYMMTVKGRSRDSIQNSLNIYIYLDETFYYNFCVWISNITSTDISYTEGTYDKSPFKEKNFAEFDDTLRLDNECKKRFSDMIIVKGKGLAEFYDKENNYTWRLT